jgi:hypothetical protein
VTETKVKEKAPDSDTPELDKVLEKQSEDDNEKSKAKPANLDDDDVRFKFGPPLIQTPEDAQAAFLRGVLDEGELRAALGRFGVGEGTIPTPPPGVERLDYGFENKLPEDLFDPVAKARTLEERLEIVDAKAKDREKAAKEDEEARKNATPVRVVNTLGGTKASDLGK